jgi:hypothetical protein
MWQAKKHLNPMSDYQGPPQSRIDDLRRFYKLLEELQGQCGGFRRLADCTGRMAWPKRGVYFFFENGENRSDSGIGLRVVRVGAHALIQNAGTTLWNRLQQHRGNANGEGGNHRGSVFRLLIGDAVINNQPAGTFTDQASALWGVGGNAPADVRNRERPIEYAVCKYLGNMPFLWIGINADPGPNCQRGILERNCIGLLSNYRKEQALDPPSKAWLGHHSSKETVRNSGLWNQNHIGEGYDIGAIERIFEQALEEGSI